MNPLASDPRPEGRTASFATTRWSLIIEAQGDSSGAQHALEQLCRIYWPAIYAFLRREGRSVEDAQDLAQAFFTQLLKRGDFAAVRREKGRLRSYLLGSLKHFLANERRRGLSLKRGGGRALISLEELQNVEAANLSTRDLPAEQMFDRRWALTVLDEVFARLKAEFCNLGRSGLNERLCQLLSDEPDRPSLAEIAREFAMTENAVKQALFRLRQRYRQLLRDEVAHTVATPADIETELRELVAALRA